MPRSSGDGKRYQVRRVAKGPVIGEPDWDFIENAVGGLSDEAKAEIKYVNQLYAMVGPQHDPRKTLLLSEFAPLLQNWIDASAKLKLAIATDGSIKPINKNNKMISRADIIVNFHGELAVKRIGQMLPLQFLDLVISAAIDTAAVVEKELSASPTTIKIELWKAWVALIGDTLKKNNIEVAASLRTKTKNQASNALLNIPDHYSPFLRLLLHLQKILPPQCRRSLGDENFCKQVQETFRETKHLDRVDLITLLAGYGTGLLGELPNGLRGLKPNQIEIIQKRLRNRTSVS